MAEKKKQRYDIIAVTSLAAFLIEITKETNRYESNKVCISGQCDQETAGT